MRAGGYEQGLAGLSSEGLISHQKQDEKRPDEMKGCGLLTPMLLRQIEQSCEYDWEAPFAELWAVMFLSLLCVCML